MKHKVEVKVDEKTIESVEKMFYFSMTVVGSVLGIGAIVAMLKMGVIKPEVGLPIALTFVVMLKDRLSPRKNLRWKK